MQIPIQIVYLEKWLDKGKNFQSVSICKQPVTLCVTQPSPLIIMVKKSKCFENCKGNPILSKITIFIPVTCKVHVCITLYYEHVSCIHQSEDRVQALANTVMNLWAYKILWISWLAVQLFSRTLLYAVTSPHTCHIK
jgi:hypothetical protein